MTKTEALEVLALAVSPMARLMVALAYYADSADPDVAQRALQGRPT